MFFKETSINIYKTNQGQWDQNSLAMANCIHRMDS